MARVRVGAAGLTAAEGSTFGFSDFGRGLDELFRAGGDRGPVA